MGKKEKWQLGIQKLKATVLDFQTMECYVIYILKHAKKNKKGRPGIYFPMDGSRMCLKFKHLLSAILVRFSHICF